MNIFKYKLKYFKNILIAVCAVMVFLCMQVYASDDQIAGFTFKNKKTDATRLSVKKTVTALYPSYPPTGNEEFTFLLKLDGSPAKNTEYFLADENGKKLYNYTEGISYTEVEGEIEAELKTDRNGKFTIPAGTQAIFEGVTIGMEYEIKEYPVEDFVQIEPAGGVGVTGTIEENGTTVEFINRYEPEIPQPETDDPPIRAPQTTTIHVNKNIIYPAGYELPQTDNFTFNIKINSEAWSNMPFTIKNGDNYVESTTTNSGQFTLKGGEEAIFEEIPQNADYEITEEESDNWILVNSNNTNGLTNASGSFVTFTNSNLAFGVKKTVTNSSDDNTNFEFKVTDNNGDELQASYYLYDSQNNLIYETAQETTSDGIFHLKGGQTAIFTGIATGTVYNIKETQQTGYAQTYPRTREGYTDKRVTDTIATWTFNNANVETGDLKLSKEVTGALGDDTKAFNFTITLNNSDIPLLDSYICQTGEEESIMYLDGNKYHVSLKDGESFTIKNLPAGTSYIIKEDNYSDELYIPYITMRDGIIQNVKCEGTLESGLNSVQYENHELHTNVTISKIDSYAAEIQGASLKITGREDGASSDIDPITWISGSDGMENNVYKPHVVTLMPGTYLLEEVTTPDKHVTADTIAFAVTETGEILVNNHAVNKLTMTDINTYNITVKKQVTGSSGDVTQKFDFTIKFTDGTEMEVPDEIAYRITSGSTTTNGTATLSSSGTYDFKLAHNETITFLDVPYKTGYKVTETNRYGYATSSENDTGTLTADTNVTFTNSKNAIVPTGINQNYIIWITILGFAIAILIIIQVYRRFFAKNIKR